MRILWKLITNNWKTSGAGVLVAAAALLSYYGVVTVESGGLWLKLLTAVGLLLARDGDNASANTKPQL